MNWHKVLIGCFALLFASTVFAQDSASTSPSVFKKSYMFVYNTIRKETYGKNIIKYNPMSSFLFSDPRNTGIGYERTTWRNQSVSVNASRFFLPRFLADDIGAINVDHKKQYGYIFTIDYRFYLKKHNTRPAPNGAYIGPFFSSYHNKGGANFKYVDDNNNSPIIYTAELNNKFSLYNLGFQFGYQFIFGKRISLDLVLFGPAFSYYIAELDLKSNLSLEQSSALYEKYYDKILSEYPILNELARRGNFKKNDFSTGIFPNFRYSIQFGYHF